MADPSVAPRTGNPLLYLHRSENSTPAEQLEGHLPEESFRDVYDDLGKPGPEGIGIPVA